MPLIKSDTKQAFSSNVAKLRNENYPLNQALAIAFSTKRKAAGQSPKKKK